MQSFHHFKTLLKEMWDLSTFFKVAILVNFSYALILLIIFFGWGTVQEYNVMIGFDFEIFYNAGKMILEDPINLYQDTSSVNHFRYFPFSAIFYSPFSLFSFHVAYLLMTILTMIGLLLISIFIFAIGTQQNTVENKLQTIRLISFFLISPIQIENYMQGQNIVIICLLLLGTYYFFEISEEMERHPFYTNFCGGLCFTTAILLKPLLLSLGFLMIKWAFKDNRFSINPKPSFFRILAVGTVGILTNLLYFTLYPNLFSDFITRNQENNETLHLFSNSISPLIANLFHLNLISVFFGGMVLSTILVLFLIFKDRKIKIEVYILGLLNGIIFYYSSWNFYILFFSAFFILFLTSPHSNNVRTLEYGWKFILFFTLINNFLAIIMGFNLFMAIVYLMLYCGLVYYNQTERKAISTRLHD